jgi:hypothetical protein
MKSRDGLISFTAALAILISLTNGMNAKEAKEKMYRDNGIAWIQFGPAIVSAANSARLYPLGWGGGYWEINSRDAGFAKMQTWVRTNYFSTDIVNASPKIPEERGHVAWGRSICLYNTRALSEVDRLLIRLPINPRILDDQFYDAQYRSLENIFKEAGHPYTEGYAVSEPDKATKKR